MEGIGVFVILHLLSVNNMYCKFFSFYLDQLGMKEILPAEMLDRGAEIVVGTFSLILKINLLHFTPLVVWDAFLVPFALWVL